MAMGFSDKHIFPSQARRDVCFPVSPEKMHRGRPTQRVVVLCLGRILFLAYA